MNDCIEKDVPDDVILVPSEDPRSGKIFKYFSDGSLYVYLFSATPKESRTKLVVVYQDVESKQVYTRPWNNFFSCIKGVPRFQEQLPSKD